jgi:hypothetical protein
MVISEQDLDELKVGDVIVCTANPEQHQCWVPGTSHTVFDDDGCLRIRCLCPGGSGIRVDTLRYEMWHGVRFSNLNKAGPW